MRPQKPQAKIAAEILYNNIANLPHPDGNIRLVYFGHQSEGQKIITRNVAEAIVMLLEENGHHICNGLDEAADLLRANGWIVASPAEVDELPADPLTAVPSPVPFPVPFGESFSENNPSPDSPDQLKLGE